MKNAFLENTRYDQEETKILEMPLFCVERSIVMFGTKVRPLRNIENDVFCVVLYSECSFVLSWLIRLDCPE